MLSNCCILHNIHIIVCKFTESNSEKEGKTPNNVMTDHSSYVFGINCHFLVKFEKGSLDI